MPIPAGKHPLLSQYYGSGGGEGCRVEIEDIRAATCGTCFAETFYFRLKGVMVGRSLFSGGSPAAARGAVDPFND